MFDFQPGDARGVPEVPIEAQQLPRARELARMLDDVPIRRSETLDMLPEMADAAPVATNS
jgi:hypothetical protein